MHREPDGRSYRDQIPLLMLLALDEGRRQSLVTMLLPSLWSPDACDETLANTGNTNKSRPSHILILALTFRTPTDETKAI